MWGVKPDKAVRVSGGKSKEAPCVMSLGSRLVGPEEQSENDTDLEGEELLGDLCRPLQASS